MSSINHYENFPVASWLCPAALRPAVQAIYHFARTADDLADEGDEPAHHRLDILGEYRADLFACINSEKQTSQRWPHIFNALALVIRQYQLPTQPLFDLLDAFEQDVIYTSMGRGYRTREELLDYCRRSANPVGRLMLHLFGVTNSEALAQSDAICTALQLINFWQDRQIDLQRGRDYMPQDSQMTHELKSARELMHLGLALPHQVKGRAGWELRAVVQGGLRILDKLDRLNQKLGSNGSDWPRPVLGKTDAVLIAWRCVRMST